MPSTGSSPRVRGKRLRLDRLTLRTRIIPARAGQTTRCIIGWTSPTDHPRACGANEDGHLRAIQWKRIIPARAGQTLSSSLSTGRRTDHPRACGANPLHLAPCDGLDGSSPRVRGKLDLVATLTRADRIIPARAGQTDTVRTIIYVVADHPRACGANPLLRHLVCVRIRIIPARAGQTRACRCRLCCRPDHPRACGANVHAGSPYGAFAGSSPRVRGKPPRT